MRRVKCKYVSPGFAEPTYRWLDLDTMLCYRSATCMNTGTESRFVTARGQAPGDLRRWTADATDLVLELVPLQDATPPAVPMVPAAPSAQAFKADAGKPDFDLLMSGMPEALLGVVKVLSWAVAALPCKPYPEGGKGYVPNSWKEVPEAKRRYRAAMQRHENALARGETNDHESGLPHRDHIATNALFLAQLEHTKEKV